MKKVLSVFLSIVLFCFMIVPSFAAEQTDYSISNPYENIDWNTYNYYKADLHCHTTASDGTNTLKEMVEKHYDLGYDIVATSDHGTVSYSWTDVNYSSVIKAGSMISRGNLPVEVLKNSGKAANGKTYTMTSDGSDDYYSQSGGKEMLRVPFAIENNPTSFNNAHVNSFFADYGDGVLGGTSDYETPIKNVDALGGVSVINHPGEYTSARDEIYTADAYNRSNFKYAYDINKFENILADYDTCIGIDINSKGDNRTRFDRKLWDTMLTDLIPQGRNVFAIASSDAHNLDIVNSGYVMALMPSNTSENLQSCLMNGEFFAQSRYIGNVDELAAYSKALIASGNKTATYVGDEMQTAVNSINSEISEKGKQSTIFSFDEDASNAVITGISVDNSEDSITIKGDGILYVRWISGGEEIAKGNTVDLDECNNVGNYVRAEIIGKGGIVYTQAFQLSYDGMPQGEFNNSFTDLGGAASAVCDTIVKFAGRFKGIFDIIITILGLF